MTRLADLQQDVLDRMLDCIAIAHDSALALGEVPIDEIEQSRADYVVAIRVAMAGITRMSRRERAAYLAHFAKELGSLEGTNRLLQQLWEVVSSTAQTGMIPPKPATHQAPGGLQ